jgi:GNAT superfamily N-acetyltransferase
MLSSFFAVILGDLPQGNNHAIQYCFTSPGTTALYSRKPEEGIAMTTHTKLTIQKDPYTKKEMKYLFSHFAEGSQATRKVAPVEEIFFSLKDGKGNLVGGAQGYYFYGSGLVDMVWVEKPYRQKGYGHQLVEAFEQYVQNCGATFMTVSTMDWWDAIPFYKSMGYAQGSTQYLLRKNFKKDMA